MLNPAAPAAPSFSLLDLQIHLDDKTFLQASLAGFSFGTDHELTSKTDPADIASRKTLSSSALNAILTAMYTSPTTRWTPASLKGDLHPAGYLVPCQGLTPSSPPRLRYVVAPSFVGTKVDHFPANPFHLIGFSGPYSYSRGADLTGASLTDASLSVSTFSYNESLAAASPLHFRSVPTTRNPTRIKALKDLYPAPSVAITATINALIKSSTEEDSFHSFWIDGMAELRVSLPAIFPIPHGTSFALSMDVELTSSISSSVDQAALLLKMHANGAHDASFLLEDPIFQLFVDAVVSHPLSFTPVSDGMQEFSSLAYIELQEAARASCYQLIADNLDLHYNENAPLTAYKNSSSATFRTPTWTPVVQSFFESCPTPSAGLKSIFSCRTLPTSQPHHASFPVTPPANPFTTPPRASGSLFSSVLSAASCVPGGNVHAVQKLSPLQDVLKSMGIIDFISRKGMLPFTSQNQDFNLFVQNSASPNGLKKLNSSTDFLLADLNSFAEISDNINRIATIKDNFRQCQNEVGLVTTHCQSCTGLDRFFSERSFGKLFTGPLCQSGLSDEPFNGFSPILCLLLFDEVEMAPNGLPRLPVDGFQTHQLAVNFVGSILVLLTYLWSYSHTEYTVLFQGYTHLLEQVMQPHLRANWNKKTFNRGLVTIKILELAHNFFAGVAKHAHSITVSQRSRLLLESPDGSFAEILSVPSKIQYLQTSVTFTSVINSWYTQSIQGLKSQADDESSVLSSQFSPSSVISHFLLSARSAPLPPLPLPRPVPHPSTDTDNPAPKKKSRLEQLVRIPKKKPLLPTPGCHVIDPVSILPEARAALAGMSLPQPTGGIHPRRDAQGKTVFSNLCFDYLCGIECPGTSSCGYHLSSESTSLKGASSAYKPLRAYFITHKAHIKPSPAALSNATLFPS